MTPRKAAVLSLNSCTKNEKFVNLELNSAIKKYGFEEKDRTFFTRLLYGTMEKKITLDYIIGRLSSVELEKIERLVLCILETGLYQVFFMDKVPDSAACNEATELVKTTCHKAYAGYVNAIMRNAVRQKEAIISEIKALKGVKGISVRYSVPLWLCELWERDYGCGLEIVGALCGMRPHTTLRVNTLKTTADELCERLKKSVEVKKINEKMLGVCGSCVVNELDGYDDGLFFVQDVSSVIVSDLATCSIADDEKNPVVVDTCSCPGGKSFSTAINLRNRGTVHSFDLHENRLRLVRSGAERLGIKTIVTEERDGRCPDERLFGKADVVICDVPCSGLGVIAKKPDIRYKKYEDIEQLPLVQFDILNQSKKYVRDGGYIVYSTCTLRRAENEDVVKRFLAENPDFSLCPTGISGDKEGCVTFLPHKTKTDGFFAAKLVKRKTER